MGDVICTVPVLRRLRMTYPDAEIQVSGGFADVFAYNPYTGGISTDSEQYRVDLDLAYERRPQMHVIDAYMEESFGDTGAGWDKSTWLHREHRWKCAPSTVLIHAARSWPNRTFDSGFWDTLAAALIARRFNVTFVGNGMDYGGPRSLGCDSAVGALSLHQTAGLIADAALIVGSDSGLLHVAGTTQTPIVGLYTCARAAYRIPFRPHVIGIDAKIECAGCLQHAPVPTTSYSCNRGDNEWIRKISPEEVLQAITTLVQS